MGAVARPHYSLNQNSKYGLTPRVKHACRLYASAAVATKKEAAEAVGLNPTYFNVITQPGHKKAMPEAIELIDEIQRRIEDKTVDLSAVVQEVSREALAEVRKLIKNSNNEAIRLKASSDILDRNPETSKTQKIQASTFSLSGEDARALSRALVLGARANQEVPPVTGDYVRIPQEKEEEDYTDAGQRLLATALRRSNEGGGASITEGPDSPRVEVHDLPAGPASEGSAPEDPAPPQGRSIRLVTDTDAEVVDHA